MNKLINNSPPHMNVLRGYYGLRVNKPPQHKIKKIAN